MTEYDYSPGAQVAYQAKLNHVANWTANVPDRLDLLSNPFVPSANGHDSDFFSNSRGRKSRNKSKIRKRGYGSDGGDSDSESEYGGPDRPATPPASAPVAGGMGFYGFSYPRQPQPQRPPPVSSNVLVPTWNGSTWVYQPQSSTGAATYTGYPMGSPGAPQGYGYGDRERSRGRERRRSRSRPKAHRRNSQSVPAVGSFYNYLGPTTNNGYLYPVPNTNAAIPISPNTTPSPSSAMAQWTTRSAPLPLPPMASPTGYFPPQARYFPPQQQMASPQPMMTSPGVGTYQTMVQSPPGSVQSGYASPPTVYGYPYGPPIPAPPPPPYGYPYGSPPGFRPPVIIMDSAQEKKAKKRSFFGRLTGGM